ncbi:hypothetical protein NDI56_03860 [Haloarcula sp. S1CR25-12]|uniref:Uncharacterized protein n=1 Tax=Haloarcula saliterrae TaxID=2950534 RepID=A0ABU2FA03_9EURY|nr:hypothetical protein [Haloarcula sp. S1CR25-12]MDS0258546.1 hypothetical protein [Haloarcula sp. S1CR25-12]
MRPDARSFSDPDTEFEIIREIQSVGRGGCTALRPTGEVRCLGQCADGGVCGRVAAAPEYIPHREGCDQADVVSEFYAGTH